MTLEERARLIAEKSCGQKAVPVELEALRHLREAVDDALKKVGAEVLSHPDWVGS